MELIRTGASGKRMLNLKVLTNKFSDPISQGTFAKSVVKNL